MAFVPIPNAMRIRTTYQQYSEFPETIFHAVGDHAATLSDCATVADAVVGWLNTWWAGVSTTEAQALRVEATSLESAVAPQHTSTPTGGVPGLLAGLGMPTSVTLAEKLLTAERGRSFRGRVYHVGIARIHVVGNQVVSPYFDDLTLAYEQLILALSPTGFLLAVASYQQGGVKLTTGQATAVIAVSPTDNVVDTQRRRLHDSGS